MKIFDEPGAIPDGWAMPRGDAADMYGSVIVAEVLEGMPHAAVVKGFRAWLAERDISTTNTWGLPDFRAAMCMTGMSRDYMAEVLEIPEEHIEMIEAGILVPTVGSLLMMAKRLEWPAAVFFRNARGWHRRTELGRNAGYPPHPLEGERRYPGWITEIVDKLDALGGEDE